VAGRRARLKSWRMLSLSYGRSGNSAEFSAVYPFREGRNFQASAVRNHLTRVAGIAEVIHTTGDLAVLVLAGAPLTGNSGDDTAASMSFSGLYEASALRGRWRLAPP